MSGPHSLASSRFSRCGRCGALSAECRDSRWSHRRAMVRRRRACRACGHRWSTFEVDEARLLVLEQALETAARLRGELDALRAANQELFA